MTNPQDSTLKFSADQPITSINQDRLGRGSFAITLANAITTWKGDESLVVALYGAWGSGKSSIKNLLVSLLESSASNPRVVDFNPWAWSGENRLTEAFFEEIGIAIGAAESGTNRQEIANRWKLYSARLRLGGSALESLKVACEIAAVPWAPLILGSLASATRKASETGQEAADAVKMATEANNETVAELKRRLREAMATVKTPLLIIIDDVDRLETSEVRKLFQLIKANADFPNLIYLLLFDRDVVERALEGASGDSGKGYMDKIVQAGLDLPKVQQSDLDSVLIESLNEILDTADTSRTFDADRWRELYFDGLRIYCNSLRNVHRFNSHLSFQLGMHNKSGVLEVNIIDLIGIEALRVFEPRLYGALWNNPTTVLDCPGASSRKEDAERKRLELEDLLKLASSRKAAESIVSTLFPQVTWIQRGHSRGHGSEKAWMSQTRICHDELFHRYFVLCIPKGDIALSLIDRVVYSSADQEALTGLYRKAHSEGMLEPLLRRLESFPASIPIANAQQYVGAIFAIGDLLTNESRGLFDFGSSMTACRLLHHFLLQILDPAVRGEIVIAAMEQTEGSLIPIEFVSLEEPRSDEDFHSSDAVLIPKYLARAKEVCIDRIRRAARTKTIFGPHLGTYLSRWRKWAGDDEPRRWAQALDDPNEIIQVVAALVTKVHVSSAERSYVSHVLKLKNLESFMDINKAKAAIDLLRNSRSPTEMHDVAKGFESAIDAFSKALSRREQGLPDTDDIDD